MNINLPVATELWQQVPPTAQLAILEAWIQAERQRLSLEERVRELQSRLQAQEGVKETPPPFAGPGLEPVEAVRPEQEAKLSKSRRHRHRHRRPLTPAEKLLRRHKRFGRVLKYARWPALVLAGLLLVGGVVWGVVWFIHSDTSPPLERPNHGGRTP